METKTVPPTSVVTGELARDQQQGLQEHQQIYHKDEENPLLPTELRESKGASVSADGWVRVEPWNSLLYHESDGVAEGFELAEQDSERAILGGTEREGRQDRRLAEAQLRADDQVSIPQDVRRTRTDNALFRQQDVRDWLQQSVALFCQERNLRYTQGLTELAAPWALITDPPCLNGFSYRCFSRFVDLLLPHMFAMAIRDNARDDGDSHDDNHDAERETSGREGQRFVVLEAHLALLDQLLQYHDPVLAARMEACRLSADAYATPWFLTLFARQSPIPVVLHLWRRLLEYGDPVLHQFLALAWLLSNRKLILDKCQDEVPKTLSKLHMRSVKNVDDVFQSAVELCNLTPRLFSRMFKTLCYDGEELDRGGLVGGVHVGPYGEHRRKRQEQHKRQGRVTSPRERVSILRGMEASGIILADADQVAEILLSHAPLLAATASADHTSTCSGNKGGVDAGVRRENNALDNPVDGGQDRSVRDVTPDGCRFVFVDCRSQSERANGAASAATDVFLPNSPEIAVGEDMKAGDVGLNYVLWRRIDPVECLGIETIAVTDILREFSCQSPPQAEQSPERAGEREEEFLSGARDALDTSRNGFKHESSATIERDFGGTAPYSGMHKDGDLRGLSIGASASLDSTTSSGSRSGGIAPSSKVEAVSSPGGRVPADDAASSRASSGASPLARVVAATPEVTTHICFIGAGQGGIVDVGRSPRHGDNEDNHAARCDGDDARSRGSHDRSRDAVAMAREAGGHEYRLARTASSFCLVRHVCVMEGGFPALNEAFMRKAACVKRERGSISATPEVDGIERIAVTPSSSQKSGMIPLEGVVQAVVDTLSPLESERHDANVEKCGGDPSVAEFDGFSAGKDEIDSQPVDGNLPTEAETAAVVDATNVPPALSGADRARSASTSSLPTSNSSTSTANGTIGAGVEADGMPAPEGLQAAASTMPPGTPSSDPARTVTPAHSFERKVSKLASNSRISEPFRVYAAKSADEMGRALRSLPLAAGKPLEDAARVCNSLAKANVKAIGESRLVLSRSVAALEKLESRIDHTAAGFARNFGAGRRR